MREAKRETAILQKPILLKSILPNLGPRFEVRLLITFLLLVTATSFISVTAIAQNVPSELYGGFRWRLIGPFRGGRVVAVAGVPGDSTTFYFGSVDGGIWKTIDAGVVWSPVFDGQNVGSVGALAVARSNPKIIYAGTGESDIREDLSTGNGVYKSMDGGSTWSHIGLDDTRQISQIVIDPQNPDIVYVGALGHAYAPNKDRGVFKSTDGGGHWTHVLDLGPEIGISDLAMASSDPKILFAGAWHTHRPPWSNYPPIDGPGSGLYRSGDAGKTWDRLNKNGLPEGDWGRVGVDVSPNGKRVYAVIKAKKSGLYRSDDGGNTWTLANDDPRLTSRAWYFNRVTIDPKNPDVIYVPNVSFYRSEDGGKTISVLRGAPGGDDYHQLWIDPANSASMILGSDQGTTISLNRGQTWSSWYNQPTAQFYHVTTDNQFPYAVYGTQQDSGSAAVFSRTDHGQITSRDWFLPGSSESGYLVVDPNDPGIIYLSETYGTISRFDRKTGLSQDISPWPAFQFEDEINQRKYRDPWTPALVASPLEKHTLYLGTQYVMKTVDGGLHWDTISPDLTGAEPARPAAHDASTNGKPAASSTDTPDTDSLNKDSLSPETAKRSGYGVVFSIAPSPLNRDLIWAGSDTGLIHITRDGGKNWKNVTPQELGDWSKISMLEASRFDPATAYVAVDRGRLDDQTPYIYRTLDYGTTWKLITDGITAPAFARSIREDPQNRNLLFAGTEFGVYVSFDNGDHWQSLQLNLPISSIRDLTIHGDDLVAATFGRSFWILDDITPLRQIAEAGKARGPWLYRPQIAIRVDNDGFPGTPLPPEEPTARNPPDGAVIDYFLPSPAKDVRLEIFDAKHDLVRKFSSDDSVTKPSLRLPVAEHWFPKPQIVDKSAGMHRFVWSLAWHNSGGPSVDDDAESTNPSGPRAAPGMYQVRLTVDGKTEDQQLKVVMDPRSSATPEVLSRQLQMGLQIFNESLEARRALAEIASVQKQLVDIQQKLEQPGSTQRNTEVKSMVSDAQSMISEILKKKDPAANNDVEGLQVAYSGLTSALRVVKGGDREIPSQAIAVYKESSGQVKSGIAEWMQFKQTQLAKLNQHLRTANLTPIAIAEIEEQVQFLMSR